MPPPAAIQAHTFNEAATFQSFSSQNRFSVLNSDIEGEVDVEHGNGDNIDEPCASQEELVVLVKLRSFKQFIIDSGTHQIREKYLAETPQFTNTTSSSWDALGSSILSPFPCSTSTSPSILFKSLISYEISLTSDN
jgi:hypothetical protein